MKDLLPLVPWTLDIPRYAIHEKYKTLRLNWVGIVEEGERLTRPLFYAGSCMKLTVDVSQQFAGSVRGNSARQC